MLRLKQFGKERGKATYHRSPFRISQYDPFRVYQLELLEFQDTGDLTPHGVVLALVGSEVESPHSKECDTLRNIRMYNLASLTSLARWCTSQKVVFIFRHYDLK